MTLYNIISTGELLGLVEVVNDAETIATIQTDQGGSTMAFDKKYLLEWLASHNSDPDQLKVCKGRKYFDTISNALHCLLANNF
jgi:hypothetical protein